MTNSNTQIGSPEHPPLATADAGDRFVASLHSFVPECQHPHARIMLVDDDQISIDVVESYLEEVGYSHFISETDPRRAIAAMTCERPDVVLLDVRMPLMNGFELLRVVRNHSRLNRLPVIILTASSEPETKLQAFQLGANDFLSKPVDPSELALRMQNVLDAKAHRDELADYSERLERHVLRRTTEVEESRREVVECLAQAAEFRDDDTGQHIIRVGRYVGIIARELGFDVETAAMLEQAAQLHDVGKIGIPDNILLKPAKFTPEEFNLMKRHAELGRRILDPKSPGESLSSIHSAMQRIGSRSPLLQVAATIAETHHEKWDGSGYPRGLRGEAIPIEGRITAVADVFDGLSSARPYKPAFPHDKCIAILREGRGTHFDARVLDAFFSRESEILDVRHKYTDRITDPSDRMTGAEEQ